MIRNIVFDMGNVLLWYEPILPCRRHAASEEDAQVVCRALFGAPEWASRMDAGTITEGEYLALIQSRLQTPVLRALADDVLSDWHVDGLYPVRGMDELASRLHAAGLKLFVLSNMCTRFRQIQYKLPSYALFEGALVSAEEKLLKPDPAIYLRLCEKFSLAPQECLFVDDLQRNANGAAAAGMLGYCFADGDIARLEDYIRQHVSVDGKA